MPDRNALIAQTLAKSPWRNWQRISLASDASARRYERLLDRTNGNTVILMDAPSAVCGSLDPFISVADFLRFQGLSAPEIYQIWPDDGLMVLEDLGTTLLAQAAETQDPAPLYAAAIEALAHLQQAPVPAELTRQNSDSTVEFAALAWQWYAGQDLSDTDFRDCLTELLTPAMNTERVISLVDYHAENIVWRPDLSGLDRVGLLDFQDATAHHPAFDLALLLGDPRRDIAPSLRRDMLSHYLTLTGRDEARFIQDFALIGAVRQIRLLGIFARLARRDGKPGYLEFLPRVWENLTNCLAHPSLTDTLRPIVLAQLPPPDQAQIDRLRYAS